MNNKEDADESKPVAIINFWGIIMYYYRDRNRKAKS